MPCVRAGGQLPPWIGGIPTGGALLNSAFFLDGATRCGMKVEESGLHTGTPYCCKLRLGISRGMDAPQKSI
eukprot:2115049-Amphidinium_carterae.1